MRREEINLIKKWVRRWQSASVRLEKIRRKQIRNTDTRLAIECLDDAFRSSLVGFTPKPTPGLMELERLLSRLEEKR